MPWTKSKVETQRKYPKPYIIIRREYIPSLLHTKHEAYKKDNGIRELYV